MGWLHHLVFSTECARGGRAVAALPRRLQTAAGPAGVGLRALRAATWAAALTLATLRVRGACFTAADYACLAAQRCAPARRLCLAGLRGPPCRQCRRGLVPGCSITGACLPGAVQDGILLRRPCVLVCACCASAQPQGCCTQVLSKAVDI